MPRGHSLNPEATRAKLKAAQTAAWSDPAKRAWRSRPYKYKGTRAERRRLASLACQQKHRAKYCARWRANNEKKLAKEAGRPRPTLCEVCGKPGKICFDHSHAKGAFRGWLCSGCNLALGHSGDSSIVLRKLADYLEGK